MVDIRTLRASLPAVTHHVYLNTGTYGPLPDEVRAAMESHFARAHREGRSGDQAYAAQSGLEADARAALARVVHAPAESVALTHCTSDGLNLVVGGIDWEAGDEVLVGDAEHPGLLVPLQYAARRHGVVVRVLPVTGAVDPAQVVADALGPRTRLVALSHVIWSTGRVLPVEAIAEVVRARGALFALDGAQGPGCVPVDAPATGADVYTISGQKWLCGPSGTGGLYVRPEAVERLQPAFPGYPTMEKHPDGPRPWPGARRFEPGTVTMTALAGLIAAIEWREGIGFTDGHARAMTLAADLRARVDVLPGVDHIDVDHPSPLVALRVHGHEAEDVVAALDRDGIIVRTIPGTGIVRVSVGLWNDEEDLERLCAALAAL